MKSLLANRESLEEIIAPYMDQLAKDGEFIEIGIYRGAGMLFWMRFFEKHGKDWNYIGVDPFMLSGDESPQEVEHEATDTLTKHARSHWFIHKCKSDEYWPRANMGRSNFIVIDGDHTDEYVRRDCIGAKAALAEKAIVIMDDVHCLSEDARIWTREFWGDENIIFVDGDIQQYVILHGIPL